MYTSLIGINTLKKTVISPDLLARVREQAERQQKESLVDYGLLTGIPNSGIEDVITFFEPPCNVDFEKMEERYMGLLFMKK
jgi:hypothetical protein